MFALVIFLVFLIIALAGVPLMYALLATTVGMIWLNGLSHPLETIFLSFISGVEPFILIAVPLFIFGGNLLAKGRVIIRTEMARSAPGTAANGLKDPHAKGKKSHEKEIGEDGSVECDGQLKFFRNFEKSRRNNPDQNR